MDESVLEAGSEPFDVTRAFSRSALDCWMCWKLLLPYDLMEGARVWGAVLKSFETNSQGSSELAIDPAIGCFFTSVQLVDRSYSVLRSISELEANEDGCG